jgi:hemolysin III
MNYAPTRLTGRVPPPMPITGDPLTGEKPKHRGRLHQFAFFLSIPVGIAFVVLAPNSAGARIASILYALSVTGLYFTSGLYNRLLGTPALRSWMRWADHAMIYVLISGSYTPVCWVALPKSWSVPLLVTIWFAALVGIVIKVTSLRRFRRVGGSLYFAMGWAALAALPQLLKNLSTTASILMIVGGVLYTSGSIVLRVQRPNPTKDFGHHEVWHVFVFVAGLCHFAMNWITVAAA